MEIGRQKITIRYEDIVAELVQSGLASVWWMAITSGHADTVLTLLKTNLINVNVKVGGRAAIHVACWQGSVEIVKLLLNHGANPNIRDSIGCTPLMAACGVAGHEGVVGLLLQYGVDVNAKNSNQQTALTVSLSEGHQNIAKLLLKAGADPNVSSGFHSATPLLHAVTNDDIELASVLLECGAEVDSSRSGTTPLGLASRRQNEEMIKVLLSHGADSAKVVPIPVNDLIYKIRREARSLSSSEVKALEESADLQCTPLGLASKLCSVNTVRLMLANCQPSDRLLNECLITSISSVSRKHIETVKSTVQMLLDAGADINHDNNVNLPPLAIGVRTEDHEFVQWLLDRGASPSGRDALMEAAYLAIDDPTIAEMLISAGAGVNARYGGETALDIALVLNNNKIAELLRKHGAKTEAELIAEQMSEPAPAPIKHVPTVTLEDELFKAIRSSDLFTAKTAVNKGAKLDSLNEKKHTPLIASVKKGNAQLVKLLLDQKACTEDPEPKVGMTPLMIAAKEGHASISSLLIHAGADVNATDWNGNSVLRHAMEGGNFKIVKLLIDRGADVECKNNKGVSPLEWATKNRKSEIIKLIDERSL